MPTIVETGVQDSASTRRAASSAASTPRRRVIPNAHTSADSPASARRSNSSSSFGFDVGKPASIIGTPSESRIWATRTFSSTESDMPSPCIPSRRVVS